MVNIAIDPSVPKQWSMGKHTGNWGSAMEIAFKGFTKGLQAKADIFKIMLTSLQITLWSQFPNTVHIFVMGILSESSAKDLFTIWVDNGEHIG